MPHVGRMRSMVCLISSQLWVASAEVAEEFYSGRLGFRREPEDESVHPLFRRGLMTFVRDQARLHLTTLLGGRKSGATDEVLILVDDIDELIEEFAANGVQFDEKTYPPSICPVFCVKDPDGNRLRFMQAAKLG